MYLGEGLAIDISDSDWMDQLTNSTWRMTYGEIRELVFSAVRFFEAKKAAIQKNDFYTPESPGIKDIVFYVDQQRLGNT